MNDQGLGTRYDRILKWVAAPDNIARALENVLRKGGAPGLDGMSAPGLGAYLQTRGEEFRESLGSGSWRPGPLRKGRRLLLVPNYTDRLAFQALLQILEPLFERIFSDSNYRDASNLAGKEAREREYRRDCGYVLSPFPDKFVDMVDHQVLLRFIKKRVKDAKLLEMLGGILGNRLMEGEGLVSLERGIRQGWCLSALFCDIYLSEFDRRLEGEGCLFTRHKDSYRICLGSIGEARELYGKIAEYFQGELKVPVSAEKSLIEGPRGFVALRPGPPVIIYRKAEKAG
jgi:retron-type reverse transcriptase